MSPSTLPSLAALSLSDIGARGGRLPLEKNKFDEDRRWRLNASLLQFWMGLGESRGSFSRLKIVKIINANDGLFVRPRSGDAFVQQMLQYGIENEEKGIRMYMEVTRNAVALGATQNRGDRDAPARGDELKDGTPRGARWADLLGCTPDGLVVDATTQQVAGGMPVRGLLEVYCPASQKPVIAGRPPKRNDVDLHMHPERDAGLLLQVWEQLETVVDAQFVDVVVWKKTAPTDGSSPEEHIWLSRVYRTPKHAELKRLLAESFGEFATAVRMMKQMRDPEFTEDPDADPSGMADYRDNIDEEKSTWETDRARGMKPDERPVVGYEPAKLTQAEREMIKQKLYDWADEGMKWQTFEYYQNPQGFSSRARPLGWMSRIERGETFQFLPDGGRRVRVQGQRYHYITSRSVCVIETHDFAGGADAPGPVGAPKMGYVQIAVTAEDAFPNDLL